MAARSCHPPGGNHTHCASTGNGLGDRHIQIADWRQVYNRARGLIPLERSVLRALAVHRRCGERSNGEADSSLAPATYPTSFRQLFGQVGVGSTAELDGEPWFAGAD